MQGMKIDPLALAALLAMLMVGAIVLLDLLYDGAIEPAVMALAVAVLGPLVPALVKRYQRNGNGHDA